MQEINQEIYRHSLELAIVNKTLSLLRKLYQISLLTLDPTQLSEKISDTVRVDLNMEVVGIFLYEEKEDSLTPYQLSCSPRFKDALNKQKITPQLLKISKVKDVALVSDVVHSKAANITAGLAEIWGQKIKLTNLQDLATDSHLKAILLHPLVLDSKVIGMLLLGQNREYDTLSQSEKDSINSLVDVVAVALDKALLYEKLKETNEQLKVLDKARAEFISIASHQLRTPPATMKWYLGAVLNGDFGHLSNELKAALERTMVTNEAQIATIDDLLNASRIERGKLEFFFEKNSLEPIVSALVEQLQPLALMKKMHINYRKPSQVLPDILMDKEKIRQVINNMIDNAIKYSKQGEIKVALESDGENLIVSVQDTGKGMSKTDQTKLFQKYSRGSDSVTHATGLGLGMYVAKVIVEQHGGKIWAESPGVGLGSTFRFSLPINSNLKPTTVDLAASAAHLK